MSNTPLPITVPTGHVTTASGDERHDREAQITRLVERFYTSARSDPVLGPVFSRHVQDWDGHLAAMRDFWSSAVHRTGRYTGRPLAAHAALPRLSEQHFDRWLALWRRAVADVIAPADREPFLDLATRMRVSMAARLGVR